MDHPDYQRSLEMFAQPLLLAKSETLKHLLEQAVSLTTKSNELWKALPDAADSTDSLSSELNELARHAAEELARIDAAEGQTRRQIEAERARMEASQAERDARAQRLADLKVKYGEGLEKAPAVLRNIVIKMSEIQAKSPSTIDLLEERLKTESKLRQNVINGLEGVLAAHEGKRSGDELLAIWPRFLRDLLSECYRVGISGLDREERLVRLQMVGKELVGSIPAVGQLLALLGLLEEMTRIRAELRKDSDSFLTYLERYIAVTDAWCAEAERTVRARSGLR